MAKIPPIRIDITGLAELRALVERLEAAAARLEAAVPLTPPDIDAHTTADLDALNGGTPAVDPEGL